ncbi:MAG: fatty acid hydroxylase [Phycisphaeraceae bacterium]|nr:fatty acid hydroxylase [Phycisphaeraceae bacterium]
MSDTTMPRRQAAFREDFRLRIARLYNGPLHVLMIFSIGAATIWYCAQQVSGPAWYEWFVVPVVFVFGNLFEWWIHRFVMHRPIKGFGNFFMAIYTRHTLAHHQFFTDQEPTIDNLRDFRIVFFPPYALVTFILMSIAPAAFLMLVGFPNMGWILLCTNAAIYLNYEFFHFCCHVKNDRIVRHIPFINTIRRHHIAHHDTHQMMERNFNLTYPFADWLFGTSDLDRGVLGHLFNGYSNRRVKPSRRRIIATVDDPDAGVARGETAAE